MDLTLSELHPPPRDAVEVVEHKGIGHPDTICDAIAERLSIALSRAYLDRFGEILHHNVDKALLRGGAARPAFGGGEVLEPIELLLAGRATCRVGALHVPVDALANEAARSWLREHMHALDADRHVRIQCLVRPGSADLQDLHRRREQAGEWLANDTSCGAGFAPATDLERAVLAAAHELERLSRDPGSPEVGEDIKVMGVRSRERIGLTVACAFVGRHLRHLDDYQARRAWVARRVALSAEAVFGHPVDVEVNAADDVPRGAVYLTVTGTSAEAGDDGQVGRGNRVNGLITPCRPMTLEAAAGKNPVSHVGKLYNLVARDLAGALVDSGEIAEAHCLLVSRIGRPVRDPAVVDVRIRPRAAGSVERLRPLVERAVEARLADLGRLTDRLVAGRVSVF